MVLKRVLGSRAARSLTVASLALEAKRAFTRGHRGRAVALVGVAALTWKWTVVGMAAQGLVKLLGRN